MTQAPGKLSVLATRWAALLMALAVVLAGFAVAAPTVAQQPAPPAPGQPPDPDNILGTIPLWAQDATRPLPKVAVEPSLSSAIEDVTLRSVVRRDLQLSGEFDVIPDNQAPEGLYLADSPVDVKAWRAKGAEAVVKVVGLPMAEKGFAELRAQVYLVKYGDDPAFDKRFKVPAGELRMEAHRIADLVIGALTGTNGGFASRMTFASGTGNLRRIFVIDADGHDAKAVSPPDRLALAPAFGPGDRLYYSASINKDEYKLFATDDPKPIPVAVRGSIYGLAWNKDFSQVALSIGVGNTIQVFSGPSVDKLSLASPIGMALRPQFTPTGKLAFSGAGKWGQRIYVDGKPISPDGLFASSPTFCRHPDGIRAIFAAGGGKNTDLVVTGETGGGLVRLTQNQARNGYPACSPDGRLVAFFSSRTGGEGPGLYVMRLDGGRAQRVSTLTGDSLRWAPLPPGKAVELPVPKKEPVKEPTDAPAKAAPAPGSASG